MTGQSRLNRQPLESLPYHLAVATAFSLLAIAALGYYAWDNDQLWNLVPLLGTESGLFANDWFAQHAADSNVHIGFGALFTSLRHVIPSIDARLLIGQIVSTVLFAAVILYALRAFDIRTPHPALALLIVFLGVKLANGIGTGNATWDIYLVPRTSAHAFILLALALHHRNRPLAAGISLGGAGLVHASAGVAGLILVALVTIISHVRNRRRELLLSVGVGFVIALPVLIPTVAAQFTGAPSDPALVLDIYRFRMPYRDPLQWRWQHWIMFALVNAHLVALLTTQRGPTRRYLTIAAAVILGLSLVQWIGVATGSLIAFKSMLSDRLLPVWRIIYLLALVDALSAEWTEGRREARWRFAFIAGTIWNKWLFAPILAWDLAIQITGRYTSPGVRRISAFLSHPAARLIPLLAGIALFVLTAPLHHLDNMGRIIGPLSLAGVTAIAVAWDLRRAASGSPRRTGLYVAALYGVLCVVTVRIVTPESVFGRHWKLSRSDYGPTQELDLARWANENTPDDALIMVPPEFVRFRLTSERAVVVDYKTHGWTDSGLIEWYDRLFAVHHERHRVRLAPGDASKELESEHYDSASEGEIAAVGTRYGVDYVVARTSSDYSFQPVAQTDEWTLYHLANSAP